MSIHETIKNFFFQKKHKWTFVFVGYFNDFHEQRCDTVMGSLNKI